MKPDEFERVPMEPEKLIKGGKEVFLVSRHEGKILSVPGVDVIRGLPSFRCERECNKILGCDEMECDARHGRSAWCLHDRGGLAFGFVVRLRHLLCIAVLEVLAPRFAVHHPTSLASLAQRVVSTRLPPWLTPKWQSPCLQCFCCMEGATLVAESFKFET